MNSNKGWIALPRDIMNHWLWLDARKLQMWLAMVMMAQIDGTREVAVGNILVTVERGQFVISIRKLAQRLACSKTTLLTFLRVLEANGMIRRQNMYKISIISIVDFDSYQGHEPGEEADDGPTGETPARTDVEADADDAERLSRKFKVIGRKNRRKNCKKHGQKAGLPGQCPEHKQRIENIPPYNPPKGISTHTNAQAREGERDFLGRLMDDRMAMEAMAIALQVETKILGELAGRFDAEQTATGKTHSDYNDYKQHFMNWARYQVRQIQQDQKKQQQRKNSQTNGNDNNRRAHGAPLDRYGSRRGTEPPDPEECDYAAPL